MPAPLSLDLRKRIVESYKPCSTSYKSIAKQFRVGVATVSRLISRFKSTSNIEPLPHAGGPKRKIPTNTVGDIKDFILEKNDLTLAELCEKYHKKHNIRVAVSCMHNTLIRLGITRKKNTICRAAKNRTS